MNTSKIQSISSSLFESECCYGSLHLSHDCEISSFVIFKNFFSLISWAENF